MLIDLNFSLNFIKICDNHNVFLELLFNFNYILSCNVMDLE